MTSDNIAFVLPPKLSEEVKRIQKEMNLKSPGEVITKALALLQLSMGRRVKFESNKEKLSINSFKGFNQTISYSEKDE